MPPWMGERGDGFCLSFVLVEVRKKRAECPAVMWFSLRVPKMGEMSIARVRPQITMQHRLRMM